MRNQESVMNILREYNCMDFWKNIVQQSGISDRFFELVQV